MGCAAVEGWQEPPGVTSLLARDTASSALGADSARRVACADGRAESLEEGRARGSPGQDAGTASACGRRLRCAASRVARLSEREMRVLAMASARRFSSRRSMQTQSCSGTSRSRWPRHQRDVATAANTTCPGLPGIFFVQMRRDLWPLALYSASSMLSLVVQQTSWHAV